MIVGDGGATRQEFGAARPRGLRGAAPAKVLIHDAARPFVDAALIDAGDRRDRRAPGGAARAARHRDAETRGADEVVVGDGARDGLYAAQTPQGFPFWAICAAHEKAHRAGKTGFTDDAAIAEWAKLAGARSSPARPTM